MKRRRLKVVTAEESTEKESRRGGCSSDEIEVMNCNRERDLVSPLEETSPTAPTAGASSCSNNLFNPQSEAALSPVSSRSSSKDNLLLLVLGAIHKVYKLGISPLLGPRCRFFPFCSDYAMEAIRIHGIVRGSLLTLGRVSRCHPWCEGGYDPVPPRTKTG